MGLRKHSKEETQFQFEEKLNKLTKKQLFFIKKYASGTPFIEIKNELCINCDYKFLCFKKEIKKKLNIKSDIGLIQQVYKSNVVKINNFFIVNQRHIAFGIAYNLYTSKDKDDKFNCGNLEEVYKKVFRITEKIIDQSKLKQKF